MAKEVLLYRDFDDWVAESFVNQLQEAKGEDLTVRLNTPGGYVGSGYPMIAKFAEFEGVKKVKVDGQASSMGAFFLTYVDDVEALDMSTFVIHRAAYPKWYESNAEWFTEARKKELKATNKTLRAGFESKVDVEKFEEIAGHTMDEIFSLDDRIDVSLNAKEAKKIGLINKIVKLSPARKQAMQSHYSLMSASAGNDVMPEFLKESEATKESIKPSKNKHMTIEKLKAEHPELYAQVVSVGSAVEKDRVNAVMTYAHLDLEKVKTVIASGENLTMADREAFNLKQINANSLAKAVEESPAATTTTVVEKPEAGAGSAEITAFEKELETV